ncbi:hypothetical protein NQ317_002627 [Molorchus minor]|uniref:xanthine dehydrogenase n=1 Tax=Molorchus minor TaxID=1323400 RepID=A0ABQ9IXQ8_9CUCU|nr:hypothetical protein NQ317_002627 [Molorchus minor]
MKMQELMRRHALLEGTDAEIEVIESALESNPVTFSAMVHGTDTTNNVLVFFVNGKKEPFWVEEVNVDPEWTLLYYLRNKLKLCGTKLGCGEGGCGACTVMVSKYDRKHKGLIHLPVNACLAPICSMHGLAVTTIEGIGSTKTRLHPVQERIAKSHGSQCGFCTPGIVMSMYTLLRSTPKPTINEMEVAFQGNLCRCTGYRPIIEGYRTFTEEWELIQNGNRLANSNGGCAMGDKCCKMQSSVKGCDVNRVVEDKIRNRVNGFSRTGEKLNINECGMEENCCQNKVNKTSELEGTNSGTHKQVLFDTNEFTPYDSSQEPIFPPELKISDKYDKQYLIFKGKDITWYRPTTLSELLKLKQKFPGAKIVIGNTEVGVEMKFKHMSFPVIIQPVQISELINITETQTGVRIGASVTLNEIETFLKSQIKMRPEYMTRTFLAMVEMLNWFAGKQIRSVGALGSNIMTGSPISDMIPILMACRAELELQSKERGIRRVALDNNFFVGYRKSILEPDEILLAINVPFSKENQYFQAYKQARRREDDIAIVNAAINVTFYPKSDIIKDIKFGFGGMSFKTVTAPKTEEKLRGLPWNKDTVEIAYTYLMTDLPLDPGAPGGMIQYRRSLTLSLFFKAFLAISQKLQKNVPSIKISQRELSGINVFQGKELKSSQYFTVSSSNQKKACGEAVYCDDIPYHERELYGAFVLSTKAHANIIKIDESEALALEGVHAFISSKDIDEKRNNVGTVVHDEKVFYNDKVTAQGQIIGLIVAENQSIAQKASRKVKIEYQELEPVIISIKDAIKYESYFGNPQRVLKKGDIDKVFKEAPHVLEGECSMGGQEHFYFETQACIVVPKPEDGEIEIYSSTQNPSEVVKLASEVLGIQQNKIVAKVKRIGGGFGGKESKASMLALPLIIAANKLNRPVRCMLDRDEDIIMTGARHPFFDEVLDRAITHFENAYKIPVVRLAGYPCKTNLASNTAFRGFGGPQGMYLAECVVQHIADFLQKDPIEVSCINLYKEGDITHYNQKLINCTLGKCWDECVESSDYYNRRQRVEKFNRENRYKKRGLSIIPTKYGIAFTVPFLNQGGALVLVYTDGSVLLSHGGIEMGQGLYTKMIQVASRALGIPVEKIHTKRNSY